MPKPIEEKTIIQCSDCSETFECQRDKDKHWCVLSSDLTELFEEPIPEKELYSSMPEPEGVQNRFKIALINDSHQKNTCSLREIFLNSRKSSRKSDN